jgi:hypothetical protein
MRMFAIAASLAAFCSAQDPATTAGSSDPKAALAAFREASGGDWIVQWHPATGTPSAIYGTGLPIAGWSENSLAAARVHANALLAQHKDLLGLGDSDFREIIGARMGRSWSFTFDQFFRGLPVIEGRADIRINMSGVVAMLGSRAWPIPATFDVTPGIADEVATAAAWAKVGEPTGVPQPLPPGRPRLVIWGDIAAPALAPVFLAWEVAVSNVDAGGHGPIGRYYVDAKTGAVLHYVDDKHECGIPGCSRGAHATLALAAAARAELPPVPTTVTLMGWTRTGPDATSALVNTPLRGVVLNVPGLGARTTDANGEFVIDIAAPVSITVGALDGTHHAPIIDSTASGPTGSFTVNPGVATTIQLLTAAATTNQAAHTTLTYWVDATNEFCRAILGNTSQLATASNVTPTVNQTGSCNAYYTGNTIHFYPAGSCSNTAFSSVIAHEWGHGLDDRYGGISNSTGDGLSEGWGDIIGMYLLDDWRLGLGFQTAGVPLRSGLNTTMYGTASAVHTAGQVWMGFAWRYRENLRTAFGTQQALLISNDTVIGSIVADATNQADAVREVFIADDNDGNLLNGVPHYAQLSAAATAKGLPFPQIVYGTIGHTPLASTSQRLTPRAVNVIAAPLGGTFTQVRLHFNAGSGNVVRNMHPNGGVNGYTALLPGIAAGNVSYHIEAVHSTNNVVRLPATGELSYSVDGALQGFFLANFDSGSAGWTSAQVTTQNDWQVGDPAGRSGTSSGVAWADPQNAASAPNCFGNDLGNTIGTQTWNGSYGANVENYLRSPVINCSGKFGVKLRFKRWLTVEEGQFDQATVSCNGVPVWQNPAVGHLLDTAWQTVEYPLPMADNNPSVQLEWRLRTDAGMNLGGWNIDDVQLLESLPLAVDAELRLLPEQAATGATMTLSVSTPSSARPYLIALADAPGPTSVPGFPTMAVGGNIALFSGTTDATGNSVSTFSAPPVPSAIGVLYYTQVLTLNAAFTQWVVSNPHVNLFTQTP